MLLSQEGFMRGGLGEGALNIEKEWEFTVKEGPEGS